MKTPNLPSISYRYLPYMLGGIWLLMISSLFIAHARVSQSAKFSQSSKHSPTPVKSWTWDNKGLQVVSETYKTYETYTPVPQKELEAVSDTYETYNPVIEKQLEAVSDTYKTYETYTPVIEKQLQVVSDTYKTYETYTPVTQAAAPGS